MQNIIGRSHEKQILENVFNSKKAEFVAIYGRRRVGKTYLIRNFFKIKKSMFFQVSGLHNADMTIQLKEFKKELEKVFYNNQLSLAPIKNWIEAFSILNNAINSTKKKIILFFDEFPWMATPKSGLLQALDYYWNRFWVDNKQIKLVICGSAASWIIKNILNNKAGLHNRITQKINLAPFNLTEVRQYLKSLGVTFNQKQIIDLYMCIGGIPYYLSFIEKDLSVIQNINKICFQKQGILFNEFHNLFASLFENAQEHEHIIRILAAHREGLARADLEKLKNMKGGRLTARLNELEEAGFISHYIPVARARGVYYKIIDEYVLFYLNWIEPNSSNRIEKEIDSEYWAFLSQSSSWKAWAGYAFEALCFKHIRNIKKALAIPTGSSIATWRYYPKTREEQGTQIDLLFDRPDDTITLCEIKYCKEPYLIDKSYSVELQNKVKIYQKVTKTEKHIIIAMITSNKLKHNIYTKELITSEVTVDDFFSVV